MSCWSLERLMVRMRFGGSSENTHCAHETIHQIDGWLFSLIYIYIDPDVMSFTIVILRSCCSPCIGRVILEILISLEYLV